MIIVHVITGLEQGGAENALYRLVTISNPQLKHVVISLMSDGYYKHKLIQKNIDVYDLDLRKGQLSLLSLVKLFRLIKRISPDIVQTWMYHADLIGGVCAKLNNVPVVWGIHNFNLSSDAISFSTRIIVKICAILSRWLPDKIITCSKNAILSHKKAGYSIEKFKVIPLGYDFEVLDLVPNARSEFINEHNISESSFIFGTLARWDPQKDHRNLLAAFSLVSKENSNVYCVLYGSKINSENLHLLNLIKEFNIDSNKIILGGITNSISNAMSTFDVHVLSSIGEAFPNVVAEAMACETLVIVTDVGDAAMITGNFGWIVPPSNHIALKDAMIKSIELKRNKQLWAQRKIDSRQFVKQHFSLSKMLSSYLEVWKLVSK